MKSINFLLLAGSLIFNEIAVQAQVKQTKFAPDWVCVSKICVEGFYMGESSQTFGPQSMVTDDEGNMYAFGFIPYGNVSNTVGIYATAGKEVHFSLNTPEYQMVQSYGEKDAFLAKYSPTGKLIWSIPISGLTRITNVERTMHTLHYDPFHQRISLFTCLSENTPLVINGQNQVSPGLQTAILTSFDYNGNYLQTGILPIQTRRYAVSRNGLKVIHYLANISSIYAHQPDLVIGYLNQADTKSRRVPFQFHTGGGSDLPVIAGIDLERGRFITDLFQVFRINADSSITPLGNRNHGMQLPAKEMKDRIIPDGKGGWYFNRTGVFISGTATTQMIARLDSSLKPVWINYLTNRLYKEEIYWQADSLGNLWVHGDARDQNTSLVSNNREDTLSLMTLKGIAIIAPPVYLLLDHSNGLLLNQFYDGLGSTTFYAFAVASDGTFYTSGAFNGSVSWDGTYYESSCGPNSPKPLQHYVSAVSYHPTLGIYPKTGISKVNLFPNPTTADLTITATEPLVRILATDLNGKILLDIQPKDPFKVNLNEIPWPSGAYIFSISSTMGTEFKKVIIQH